MTDPTPAQLESNREAYERAKANAGDDGVVCGFTDEDGTPRYFVAPRDATPEDLRRRAFHARHGRPMNRSEELLDIALNSELVREYETVMTNYLEGEDKDYEALLRKLEGMADASN